MEIFACAYRNALINSPKGEHTSDHISYFAHTLPLSTLRRCPTFTVYVTEKGNSSYQHVAGNISSLS